MELHVGGRVEHVFRNSGLTENDTPPPPKYANFAGEHVMHGRITHCEPPRVLAYTWGEGDGASHVRFELDPVDDPVRLWIVHSRLPNRGEILSVGAGWHTHVDILSDRLQKRVPAGFWATHTRLEAEYERLIPPGQPHLPGGTDPPPASPAATLPTVPWRIGDESMVGAPATNAAHLGRHRDKREHPWIRLPTWKCMQAIVSRHRQSAFTMPGCCRRKCSDGCSAPTSTT